MDAISRELGSLATILDMLADDARTAVNVPDSLGKQVLGIALNCSDVVVQLKTTLEKYNDERLKTRVIWTFSGKDEMEKYKTTLAAHKSALDLALELLTLYVTLQFAFLLLITIRSTVRDIRSDTEFLRDEAADIKEDTEQILAEIAKLQVRLPPNETQREIGSAFILQKYLDNLTTYAETSYAESVLDLDVKTESDITTRPSRAAYFEPQQDMKGEETALERSHRAASVSSAMSPSRSLTSSPKHHEYPVTQAKHDDGDGSIPLHDAALRGQSARILELLQNGADIYARDRDGGTALHPAAACGHRDAVRVLLDHKADVNARTSKRSWTPLHFAAQSGNRAVVKLLLQHRPEIDNKGGVTGATPLSRPTQFKHGASASVANVDGSSPLHLAAHKGHEHNARILLEHKADINARTKSGWTPLHVAVRNGREAVARILINENADLNAKAEEGTTPLHVAASNGHSGMIRLLLGSGADISPAKGNDGSTALHLAAEKGHDEAVEALLEYKADVEAKRKGAAWATPLYLAAQNGHETVAEKLLESGAGVSCATMSVAELHKNEALLQLLEWI
jgi:ankyrin repeat protein